MQVSQAAASASVQLLAANLASKQQASAAQAKPADSDNDGDSDGGGIDIQA